MIAFLKGKVVSVSENRLVLDVNDVGFQISITSRDAARMPSVGHQVLLYTYLSVREDAMQLFGFLSEDDLEIYRLLIGVSGIGPKAGLGILSVLSADDLRFAVLADDAKAIARAPGVGNKTAQKLILELKDKLSLEEAIEKKLDNAADGGLDLQENKNQAVQALVALGYSGSEALRAVKQVEISPDMDTEDILKQALKKMV
ncbi:MAG TPA: Holliday junction branch migration protein RuvA [Candidatus Merdiplasma excrementigallinarum]|uniref:Holliday junction branch migration complex subunit RuvA n=1 Tax=Candidatus Merdiplasma excrementigallinarum TaxID=2840864 RepID=A0A9D1NZ45_9FIRM|nr:Holliday junction branch migration protein RuvA [Candidatus Merdiplasma excrementigallinarum]